MNNIISQEKKQCSALCRDAHIPREPLAHPGSSELVQGPDTAQAFPRQSISSYGREDRGLEVCCKLMGQVLLPL